MEHVRFEDGSATLTRMAQHPNPSPSRGSLRAVLLAALLAFLLGAGLVAYAAWHFGWIDKHLTPLAPAPMRVAGSALPEMTGPAGQRSVGAQGVPASGPAISRIAEQQGGLEQRLAAAEQRLAQLDLQAAAASGNAARAEGLLIAFAARRAVDRGAELGFLADQLRLRFGDAMPNAVATVIAGARRPVTVDQLATQLDTLSPALSTSSGDLSLASLSDELASLFVVRRATTPSVQPAQRLERAKLFLESGRIAAAVAEVRNLPGAVNAQGWIANAQRYAAVQQALDRIETAAVLEPRRLRDRNGAAVEQPSPAAAAP